MAEHCGQLALNEHQVVEAFEKACLAELQAIKPGNVGYHGGGHGMHVADFEKSALVASHCVAREESSVGERIKTAVDATMSGVGQNTNLGIVLLCAPLAHAAQQPQTLIDLQQRLTLSLNALSVADASDAFAAITQAQPAGLGDASEHDVRKPARVDLGEAMRTVAQKDRIARQYAENFADIFNIGRPVLDQTLAAGVEFKWCTCAVYLKFLSEFCDSHIVRKHGFDVAKRVQARAGEQYRAFHACLQADALSFKRLGEQLIKLDQDWKNSGVNPGTSADLTVATLFSLFLHQQLVKAGNMLGQQWN